MRILRIIRAAAFAWLVLGAATATSASAAGTVRVDGP